MLDESRGLSLPLFAFLDVDGSIDGRPASLEWDLLLFEGETKKGLVYVSAGGVHIEDIVDIFDTVNNVRSVDSVNSVDSVRSVHHVINVGAAGRSQQLPHH